LRWMPAAAASMAAAAARAAGRAVRARRAATTLCALWACRPHCQTQRRYALADCVCLLFACVAPVIRQRGRGGFGRPGPA
jgi:dolichyl-phosphate-mannose--protein O-mannosyl transferase